MERFVTLLELARDYGPLVTVLIGVAVFVYNMRWQWGWNRRRELRDQILRLAETERADAQSLGTAFTEKRGAALNEVAYVLSLSLAEPGISEARRRASSGRRSPTRRTVTAIVVALAAMGVAVLGIFFPPVGLGSGVQWVARAYWILLLALAPLGAVAEIRIQLKKRKAQGELLALFKRVSSVGSLYGPNADLYAETEEPRTPNETTQGTTDSSGGSEDGAGPGAAGEDTGQSTAPS